MDSPGNHIYVETDDTGVMLRCNYTEILKKGGRVTNRAPSRPYITGG
jgi:hypothetical protein